MKNLLVATAMLGALNMWTAFVTSRWYTAWCIRVRNEVWYFLLSRPINRERADHAEDIAERILAWLRPLVFVVVNVIGIVFVWYGFTHLR